MTLAVVWKIEDRLMAAADTRIIKSAGNVLTEHGPKLLPVNVVCRQCPPEGGRFDREVYRASVGFAYSGATLTALAAHALCNTLLSNLNAPPGAPLPSLRDIADFFAGVSAQYIREIGQRSGLNGLFAAILFGFCPSQRSFRAFSLRPNFDDGVHVLVTEHALSDIAVGGSCDASCVVIGSSPRQLADAIDADLALRKEWGLEHPATVRDVPKRELRRLIDRGSDDAVGGSVQLAWATPSEFKVVSNMEPLAAEAASGRKVGFFVLGFDTFDLQRVGSYLVGVDGL